MVGQISKRLASFGALLVLLLSSAPSYALFQSPDIDELPPAMKNRERLDGSKFSFDDFKGSPTIVYFSGFWCPICSQSTPLVYAALEKYKNQGLKLAYISADDNSRRDDLAKLETEGVVVAASTRKACPDAKCPKGAKHGPGWQINGYPTLIVLDSSGVIKFRFNTLGMIKSGLDSAIRSVTTSQ